MRAIVGEMKSLYSESKMRNAIRDEDSPRTPLGSRIAERFAPFELDEDIPELRDDPPRPANFGSRSFKAYEPIESSRIPRRWW